MCESDDEDLFGTFVDNDCVGKAPEHKALHAALAGSARQCDEWNDLLLEQVERRIDGPVELLSESWPLLFIPCCSLCRSVAA
jgi:hypothetical protein